MISLFTNFGESGNTLNKNSSQTWKINGKSQGWNDRLAHNKHK